MSMRRVPRLAALLILAAAAPAEAENVRLPILAPITGFLSLEGASQRNGAELALLQAGDILPSGLSAEYAVTDTGASPEKAVNALLRALSAGEPAAVTASMLGTQMLAMMPIAGKERVPLLTVSGTASITEQGNPYVFRFFPGDAAVKAAQVRYALEELGARRPAVINQTTAYGQSGRDHILANLKKAGVTPVRQEGLSTSVKDFLPALTKALAEDPDVLLLQLHSGPTALAIRQLRGLAPDLPVVAGSAMHQPSTAALLSPGEMAGVCAESGSSPVSAGTPGMAAFLSAYREAYGADPDAFALHQYDGVRMALTAIADGARSGAEVAAALSRMTYEGVGMTYRSDGKGNMAHDAVILCYDGVGRIPAVVRRYRNVAGAAD